MSRLSFTLKASIAPKNRGIEECVTLGDHLRKTRIDRNESQPCVAQKLGLTRTDSLTNWELNHFQPQARFNPKIIEYLGYTPLYDLAGTSFSKRIKQHLYVYGCSRKILSDKIGIDPASVSKLIDGKKLQVKTKLAIEIFLETKTSDKIPPK